MTKRTCCWRLFFCCLILGLCFGNTFVESLEKGEEERSLVVGTYVRGPWIIEKDGQLEGPEIDLLFEMILRLDFKPKFFRAPAARLLHELRAGKVDMMIGVFKRPEREKYLHYIEPAYKRKSNMVFYINKETKVSIKDYEDLYKLRLGTVRGVKHFPRFDKDKKLNIYLVNHYSDGIKMLRANRIDTFIMTDSEADYLIQQLGLQHKIVASSLQYISPNPVYIVLSKKSPYAYLHRKLSVIAETMHSSGETNSILQRYFADNNLPTPDYQ